MLCSRYASQPREVVLDCGPYRDRSGLSSSLHSELNQAIHFLNDCNLMGVRADRDPTFISKQVRPQEAEGREVVLEVGSPVVSPPMFH